MRILTDAGNGALGNMAQNPEQAYNG